ncbi:hypothetical protein BH18ACI5_BH18ACI5_17320 [soil metagenome]
MNAVETHRLTRTFGTLDAVRGLNLRVPQGSIFALMGPNGAGKTTTIKMLMNLIQSTVGPPPCSARIHESLALSSGSGSVTCRKTRSCPSG